MSTKHMFFIAVVALMAASCQTSKKKELDMKKTNSPDLINLYIRDGDAAVEAPFADIEVAKKYLQFEDKGKEIDGYRATIMSEKTQYAVNEEARILHIVEATLPHCVLYVMGPKGIHQEYLDGVNQRAGENSSHDHPGKPVEYDGRTQKGLGVDYNFEITSYRFDKPGVYRFYWNPGKWKSNILEISVK